MRNLAILIFTAAVMSAQTTQVDVQSITATQAIIHATAVNADGSEFTGNCTYRISEGKSFTTLVHDVDPTLFAGSNTDARQGSIVNGKDHYFVAGTRLAARASDGNYYSRALQANTQHWAGVTCGSAPEQGALFETLNPPLGNTYPEWPAFDSTAFGNRAVPTVDMTDQSKTYVDPLTGILIKRITSPFDSSTGNAQHNLFTYVRDVNGSAWTNPNNALNNLTSSVATTSTPNAPLFLSWAYINQAFGTHQSSVFSNFDSHDSVNDILLRANCSQTGGGQMQACISVDSGQTCATGTVNISCSTSLGEVDVPSNYPSAAFNGWGQQSFALSKAALANYPTYTVNVSGNTVTLPNAPYYQLFTDRPAGSKVQITGSSCPNNICTIAAINSPFQLTLVENAGTLTNATLQDYGAGIRVWMANTGGNPTVSANFTFDNWTSRAFFGASNAEFDTCSSLPITDISTDRSGNPISPPLTGYLCSLSGQALRLWIPATGESRLMSSYYQQGVGFMSVPTSPFSLADAKTFFATNIGTNHLYRGVLNNPSGNYTEYNPTVGTPAPDNIVWTDVTAQSAPVDQQLASYGGPAAALYGTGLFPALAFVGTIGGYAIYDTSNGDATPCIKVRTLADTNRIVQAFDSLDTFPLRWGGCHSAPLGVGSYLNLSLNPITRNANNVNMGGPYMLRITQMKRGGNWSAFTATITAATNANPVNFTSTGIGLDQYANSTLSNPNNGTDALHGPVVTISGGTGSWAAANGTWVANGIFNDPNHFTIPALNTSSFGPLTGTLTVSTGPPMIHSFVNAITTGTGGGAVITTSNQLHNFPNDEPLGHRFQDGDAIGFGGLSATQQYYAKVSGFSSTTFGVYADQGLTQPVSASSLSAAQGGLVYYAETCPAGLPAFVTTSMQLDTGAAGVRCFTVRVAGEPCSVTATAAEHQVLPCKADPNNVTKSSLQDLQVGDAIRDIGRNGYDETMVLVKKVKNSETDIECTFMRWFGNQMQGGENHITNNVANSHDVGWTPFIVPSNSHSFATGWMDANDATNTFISADVNFASAHGDFGYGNANGLVTWAAGYPDHLANKTMSQLLHATLTYNKKENPAWADSPGTQLTYGGPIESYPGHRQHWAHTPASEMVWKGDWRAMNPDFGSGQTAGAGLIGSQTLTNIRGTSYDPSSTTSNVYKISNAAGAFDLKRTPIYSWAGKFMLGDKSGPGSLITDADQWKFCVAYKAGECRPGSAQYDSFVVGSGFYNSNGYCETNTFNFTTPCLTGANPLGGWAVQTQIDPIDSTARQFRRLTLGLAAPGMHFTFQTWLQTPDSKWGFFSAPFVNGNRNEYFAMKLPPWPASDSVNRTTFVPITVKVSGIGRAQFVRARFGYAENGPPASFFCTSRAEACSTEIPSGSPGDPYSFIGEASSHFGCAANAQCIFSIPAIPGRVLYYVLDRLDSGGNIVFTSPMKAVAVP